MLCNNMSRVIMHIVALFQYIIDSQLSAYTAFLEKYASAICDMDWHCEWKNIAIFDVGYEYIGGQPFPYYDLWAAVLCLAFSA